METIDTTQIVAVFSVGMPIITSALKSLFPSVNPRYFSMAVSAVVAVSVGIGSLMLDQVALSAVITKATAVGGLIFGLGTALYKVQK